MQAGVIINILLVCTNNPTENLVLHIFTNPIIEIVLLQCKNCNKSYRFLQYKIKQETLWQYVNSTASIMMNKPANFNEVHEHPSVFLYSVTL